MPWLSSFITNHRQLGIQIKHKKYGPLETFDQFVEKGVVEVQSIAFIQGASYVNTVYVIDEFQNLSPHEARAVLSRGAKGSKFVIMGDIYQVTAAWEKEGGS